MRRITFVSLVMLCCQTERRNMQNLLKKKKFKSIELPGTDQFVRDNQEFPDLAPDWELDWDRHLYCRVVEFAKAAAVVVAAAGRAVAVVVAA